MNVQDALVESFDRDVSESFFLVAMPGESAYDHYNRLKYKVDKATLNQVFGPGDSAEEPQGFCGTIAVEIWAPLVRLSDGAKTGFSVRVRGRKLSEIASDAYKVVADLVDEYFSRSHEYEPGYATAEWPKNVHWVAVYPVTGGSEGHYVHVDLILSDGSRKMICLGKTFQGMAHAKTMCDRLIDAFGC